MDANVVKAFRDRSTWRRYAPGDAYSGDADRVSELVAAGYLAGGEKGLSQMTVKELLAVCEAEGIEVPTRQTKSALVRAIEAARTEG